jgi:hypothetical protein
VSQVIGHEGIKPSLIARRPDTTAKYGDNSPGPCAYIVHGKKPRTPSYSIGKGRRYRENIEAQRVPSPLQYCPNDKIMRKSSPYIGYIPSIY